MTCVFPEPWFLPKPLWTKTLSIKRFLKDKDCRVILRTNCIKKPGFLRECGGCQKYSECKTILVLKGTRLKSTKEPVVRYGIVTRRLILRLKKLCLLKVQQHFHGLRSVPALVNKTYYCHRCNKGYNQENAEHHNCSRQNCDMCRRKNGNALIIKKESLPMSTAMIAVGPFTVKTVLPLTRKAYVVCSKSARSVVKCTSIPRKRSMCAENIVAPTVETKYCQTISVTP